MRPVLILFLLLFLPLSAAFSAESPPKSSLETAKPFTLNYGLYAGGFRALNVSMAFNVSTKTYGIAMNAKPHGVIGSLLPWAGEYTTKGTRNGLTLTPQTHSKLSRWREDQDTDSFVYKNGVLVSLTRVDETKKPVKTEHVVLDPVLHKDSIDLLTGAMTPMMSLNAGKGCNIAAVVYDGKRRYTLKFTQLGTETLTPSKYNIYGGKAQICEIEMIPLDGFKGKKRGYYKMQEEGRAAGQLPRVWMGEIWPNGPIMPVKILLKSEYGAILVHLEKITK